MLDIYRSQGRIIVKPDVCLGPDGLLHLDRWEGVKPDRDQRKLATPVGGVVKESKCGVPLGTVAQVLETDAAERCEDRGDFCGSCFDIQAQELTEQRAQEAA